MECRMTEVSIASSAVVLHCVNCLQGTVAPTVTYFQHEGRCWHLCPHRNLSPAAYAVISRRRCWTLLHGDGNASELLLSISCTL